MRQTVWELLSKKSKSLSSTTQRPRSPFSCLQLLMDHIIGMQVMGTNETKQYSTMWVGRVVLKSDVSPAKQRTLDCTQEWLLCASAQVLAVDGEPLCSLLAACASSSGCALLALCSPATDDICNHLFPLCHCRNSMNNNLTLHFDNKGQVSWVMPTSMSPLGLDKPWINVANYYMPSSSMSNVTLVYIDEVRVL